MPIAKLLVPVRGDGKGANVLAHAAVVARRFNAHIAVLHSRPQPDQMVPFGVPLPASYREKLMDSAKTLADEEEGHLKAIFERTAAEMGLEIVTEGLPPHDRPSISWHEATGKQIDTIRIHGRLADLVLAAQPDNDRNLGANTLKSALFATGRPVLMCPPSEKAPETIGERIVVAWAGTAESARAVALGMDLIQGAAEVTVLTLGSADGGAPADELVDYLALRGVTARHHNAPQKGDVGEALVAHTKSLGGDLLLMGAYSRSHFSETVFGGATQSVIDEADIPVVLVH